MINITEGYTVVRSNDRKLVIKVHVRKVEVLSEIRSSLMLQTSKLLVKVLTIRLSLLNITKDYFTINVRMSVEGMI